MRLQSTQSTASLNGIDSTGTQGFGGKLLWGQAIISLLLMLVLVLVVSEN
jgi:hypothetical protein